MASVDLKSAFYSIPIHPTHRKYLKFFWKHSYEYVVMPNGYSDAPRVFTKVSKPGFAELRAAGHLSVVFLDDSYLQGDTFQQCQQNVDATVSMLQRLGFTIHPLKSSLVPSQSLEFLGFLIDSVNMVITLPERKRDKIFALCTLVCTSPTVTIRLVARFRGGTVSKKN